MIIKESQSIALGKLIFLSENDLNKQITTENNDLLISYFFIQGQISLK